MVFSAVFTPTLNLAISSSTYCCRRRTSSTTRRVVTVRASSTEKDESKDKDASAFNPFGFVTDNPSSRNAIQLPENPAEDGNVGQMLYRIEDKGKEYGSYVKSGKLRWFVRETGIIYFLAEESVSNFHFSILRNVWKIHAFGSANGRRGTIVFLHGAPTQSFSYRVVMSQLSDAGFHCFAPDWIGFGFSDKPQPGYGFNYTEKEFHDALDKLLEVLGVKSPFFLVVQGFLVGSYGLTWALKNSSKISKLAILNSPLTDSSPIPGLFQKLRIPLYGEFTSQNAIIAERFIEGGSPYVLKNEKADVYRLPYLASSGPGFALLEAARKANFKGTFSEISAGFTTERWDKPMLLAWGLSDKYLPQSVAEQFQKGNPAQIQLKLIEGAGHMPQEDWPEKVVDAFRMFF
ncbi:Haloalkane dehalogenase [Glycine max]|nr:Haloalkane dehalogenase [Glycine max]